MRYTLLLLLFTSLFIIETLAKRGGGGGSRGSSSRGSSRARGTSGIAKGFNWPKSSSTNNNNLFRSRGSSANRRQVSFAARAKDGGFLKPSGTSMIVTQPEMPVTHYGNTYYWDRRYYVSHPERHMCFVRITREDKEFSNITVNNSTLTEIVFGCPTNYYCCDYDCCYQRNWKYIFIAIAIVIVVYCVCQCDCWYDAIDTYQEAKISFRESSKRKREEKEQQEREQEQQREQQQQQRQQQQQYYKPLVYDQQQQQQPIIYNPTAPLLPPKASLEDI